MLSDALDIQFPRNAFPKLGNSIFHGHYLQANAGHKVIVWRDGRDVMVSWYYHCLFENELDNKALVDRVAQDIRFSDRSDISTNLPEFMEYTFNRQKHPNFHWAQFVRAWFGRRDGVVHTKYEVLRANTYDELNRIILELTDRDVAVEHLLSVVQEHSFENKAKRQPGRLNENSFMRKGIVGDWKNSFTREAVDVFKNYAGDELIELGYEKDYSW